MARSEPAERVCLKCDRLFLSESKAHRICYRCRGDIAQSEELRFASTMPEAPTSGTHDEQRFSEMRLWPHIYTGGLR